MSSALTLSTDFYLDLGLGHSDINYHSVEALAVRMDFLSSWTVNLRYCLKCFEISNSSI